MYNNKINEQDLCGVACHEKSTNQLTQLSRFYVLRMLKLKKYMYHRDSFVQPANQTASCQSKQQHIMGNYSSTPHARVSCVMGFKLEIKQI